MSVSINSEVRPLTPVPGWESVPLDADWTGTVLDINWKPPPPGVGERPYFTDLPDSKNKASDRGPALASLCIFGFGGFVYSIWDKICHWEEFIWPNGDTATIVLLKGY